MHVLVTGATGFVGSRLVPALLEAGHEVCVLVRDVARYDRDDVRVIEADLLAPDEVTVHDPDGLRVTDLAAAFAGIEVAYYLVHSMRAGPDFEERDRAMAENVITAASEAGVERVIYLGGLGEIGDDLSAHLRSRREVESILEHGGPTVTTLRAAVIIGAGSASFDMVRQLSARLPVMITPRWVRTPCQPIAVADVIAYLVGVPDALETAGQTYEIGGPSVLTYETLLRRTGRALGHRTLILPVPVLSPGLSAYWVDLVTDVPRSVAHPLVEGLRTPVVADDSAIREAVPIQLTSVDAAIERAIDDWRAVADRRDV